MDLGLNGQIALVTGATSGVGREIALSLAAEGASVAVNYRSSAEDADALVSEIAAESGKAKAYQADVADFAAVKSMVERDRQRFWRPQHPDQQCRARTAPALPRDQARGLASPDRRLPLRRNSLLPCGGTASRCRQERPHRQRHRRFLAGRRVGTGDCRCCARRRHRVDEIAGARIRPLRHDGEHGLARTGRNAARQGMGRRQSRKTDQTLPAAPARPAGRRGADGDAARLTAQRLDHRTGAQHQRRVQHGLRMVRPCCAPI